MPAVLLAPFVAAPYFLARSPHKPASAPSATHNPRYASQGTSAASTRKAQVDELYDEHYDAAFETCLALGLPALARNLGVRADPVTVARTFAQGWDPGLRAAPYDGCLRALRDEGR